jgi:hypothetical protein
LEKHVDANHVTLAKLFENVKSPLRNVLERQLAKKKRPNVFTSKLSKFFAIKDPFKMLCNKNNFCKTLPFWLSKIISLFNLLITLG